jgi:predicted PurR-regulated permease PerM
MNFPPPSDKQARIIWAALTGFALAIIVAVVVAGVWGLGQVLNVLSPVIWPLAVAAVLAYLLDPVVDFFERKGVPRSRAIGLVFFIAFFLTMAVFASVVPRLVVETQQLVSNIPDLVKKGEAAASKWLNDPPQPLVDLLKRFGLDAKKIPSDTNAVPNVATNLPLTIEVSDTNAPPVEIVTTTNTPAVKTGSSFLERLDMETMGKTTGWVAAALKAVGVWLASQVSRLAGLFGVIAGLALIPIYLFYLLLEKRSITESWTDYLPGRDARLKEELVFVIKSINDYLVAFFRGQVLVAICDGILYGIGFMIIGLPYAVVIGAVAMVLTIIPFLGAIVTCVAALLIALVTFGDWQHPLMVLAVFAVVQGIEGYVLQPKILGDRVGLHPMVIIVAVMVGTTLLGGLLGGILAIPLAAALRVILWRYVWKSPEPPGKKQKPLGKPA